MADHGHPADRGQAAALASAPQDARDWRPQHLSDRYSRRVALLKRVLPAIGVALLLLVAAWPRLGPLLDSVRLGFPAIDLREARELKMLNPRYAGIDRDDRPYVVTAAVGRQVPNRSDLMSLERPRAELITHGGAKVVLTATTGIYQSQAQLLDLFGRVTLTHRNGTRFVTRQAHANFVDNTADGNNPIQGHGPSGDIWGQGFRVLDKGDTIFFTGRSKVVLKGGRPGSATTPPAALPPRIAETAAQIVAAASPAPGSVAHRSAAIVRTGPASPALPHPLPHAPAAHHRTAARSPDESAAEGQRGGAPAVGRPADGQPTDSRPTGGLPARHDE